MAVSKTSLSAGEIIRAILIDDDEVIARTKRFSPWLQIVQNCPIYCIVAHS